MPLTLLTTITSSYEPLYGQFARSSENFTIPAYPSGTLYLLFTLASEKSDDPMFIHFNIQQDVSLGTDKPVFDNLYNNAQAASHGQDNDGISHIFPQGIDADGNFYISAPLGATNDFTVSIYALV